MDDVGREIGHEDEASASRSLVCGLLLAGVLLATAGCGSFESYDDRLKRLVGLPAARLRATLGPAAETRRRDGVDYLIYRWPFQGIPGRGEPYAPRTQAPGRGRNPADGTCTFVFAIKDDAVAGVLQAGGRTPSGDDYGLQCKQGLLAAFPERSRR